MSQYSVDTTLRIRLRHVPGQLANVAATIGEQGGLIGDITTIGVSEGTTLRDITIETADEPHIARVIQAVQSLPGVEVMSVIDRVFDAHAGGKIHSTSRVPLKSLADLRSIYTPGVARVVRTIEREPERAWDLTSIGNSVAICTNGTRVLGLGNVGPLASMPVMEGKAVIYDKLVGISATPILIDSEDPNVFIETVVRISKSFGAIHLEDIRVPDCFVIERALKDRLQKPVMHDDQHGTATAALAAILNACKMTGIDLKKAKLGQIGLGAAGGAIARLVMAYGVGSLVVCDPAKESVAMLEAEGARGVDMATLMREADIVVATTGRAKLISPDSIRKGQIIFALTNPDPEIDPDDARAAGAAFAADGRSVNNALAFPGLFRGAFDAKSATITQEMFIAAAVAIAAAADEGEIVPRPLEPKVHAAVRAAVAAKARELGLEGSVVL